MGRDQQGQLVSASFGVSWGGLKLAAGLFEGLLTHVITG